MDQIKVGVGVLILKEGKVLLGKRKSSHGEGEYATPGGHLEYMETFEECARRESVEEAGVAIGNISFLYVANLREYKPKHYVHIEVVAEWVSGDPKVLEPDRTENWEWFDLDNLPEPRFKTIDLALEALNEKRSYFD